MEYLMDFDRIKQGQSIAFYTFVYYYGKDETGCYLWKVKCSQCRRVFVFHVGHKLIGPELWQELIEGRDSCLCILLKKLDTSSTMRQLYSSIRTRCNCKTDSAYKNYGKKGIKVCERWLGMDGYLNFLEDVGPRKDRTDVLRLKKGSLEFNKDNCFWDTRKGEIREPMVRDKIVTGEYYEVKPSQLHKTVSKRDIKRLRLSGTDEYDSKQDYDVL